MTTPTPRIKLMFLTAMLASSAALSAQCPVQLVGGQSYGQGCSPVFTTPTIGFQFDAAACAIDVTVQAFPGCCNTFVTAHLLVLGFASTNVPLPSPVSPNCTLLASPDVLLFELASAGTFNLPIPPALPLPLTLFAQGGAVYFTTIGFSTDLAMTDGLQMTLN